MIMWKVNLFGNGSGREKRQEIMVGGYDPIERNNLNWGILRHSGGRREFGV
jgi:hypothetical protein